MNPNSVRHMYIKMQVWASILNAVPIELPTGFKYFQNFTPLSFIPNALPMLLVRTHTRLKYVILLRKKNWHPKGERIIFVKLLLNLYWITHMHRCQALTSVFTLRIQYPWRRIFVNISHISGSLLSCCSLVCDDIKFILLLPK